MTAQRTLLLIVCKNSLHPDSGKPALVQAVVLRLENYGGCGEEDCSATASVLRRRTEPFLFRLQSAVDVILINPSPDQTQNVPSSRPTRLIHAIELSYSTITTLAMLGYQEPVRPSPQTSEDAQWNKPHLWLSMMLLSTPRLLADRLSSGHYHIQPTKPVYPICSRRHVDTCSVYYSCLASMPGERPGLSNMLSIALHASSSFPRTVAGH